ncbi:MAG: CPBP family intramembrane metalloprotease [Bacteroidetes bacterium]|nr:CPBP family intramembrane metalloprotease [Bacteroidota bacterium]
MAGATTTSVLQKVLAAAGVALFAALVLWFSPLTVISRAVALEQSLHFRLYELHFWQFGSAFLAVIFLSRGHLWSYGINSQNLKLSLQWLAWLYGTVILFTAAAWLTGLPLYPSTAVFLPAGSAESVIAMLVYWMSSPVANQILFFSFAQTVLLKQWGDSFRLAGIPAVVIVSAAMFAAGATASSLAGMEGAVLPLFALGLFCGMVYWRTNSLIAPMLGHAFFFGFPLFIHLLRTGGIR